MKDNVLTLRDPSGVIHLHADNDSAKTTFCEQADFGGNGLFYWRANELQLCREVPTCLNCLGRK